MNFASKFFTNVTVSKIYFKTTGWFSKRRTSTAWVPHGEMQILPVPALSDNFMYIIVDEKTKECAIVDPVEPKALLEIIKEKGYRLTSAMITHHHWDHAGGNKELLSLLSEEHGSFTVIGGDKRIEGLTRMVKHDDAHMIGSLAVRCLFTPCHTTGHICYFVSSPSNEKVGTPPAVFTGDTLFLGGCGRFFEGTAEQMYRALITTLGMLPNHTRVYCGHEYAVRNLEFGVHVEPDNRHIAEKLGWARKQIASNLHSVPSTIEEEKQFNVFMRVNEKSLQEKLHCDNGVQTMQKLRDMKNKF